MLSIGKPPPDPPCACDELIPPLNSDERASSPSPQLPDLTHNPPLPNFSIRSYVFAARSKDISKNWPFSLRSLQLCQKHGVKDPLPPFQSLDNVRHEPFARSSVKTSCSLKEINRSKSTEELLRLNNEDNTRSNDGLADNNFPSMTTSVSRVETESVPTIKKPKKNLVPVKPDTLLVTSVEKLSAGPTVLRKTRTAVRSTGKKARLVVKLGGNLERSSTEDFASISSAVSETMASKVCPVCKTFSSSSNTTLNAHIDQCLSEEPTPKWSAGSKLTRHRVKPRKIRLMVDIYETAPRCTLEDLDRRNGSNWATGINLPSQDTGTAKERMQRVPPVNPDQDAGAVYVDSNGRKLRSLSSFSNSHPSSSGAGEPLGPRKCVKGKPDKVLPPRKTKKKKKKNAQKHHNNLKLVSKSKDFSSHKASQGSSDQEDSRGSRGASDDARVPVSRSQSPLLPGDNGTLKPWACSRRSALPKKLTSNESHPPHGCALHVAQDLLVERGRSYFANNPISDGYDSGSPEQPRNSGRMGVEVTEGESPGKRKLRSPFYSGPADRNLEECNFRRVKRRESQSSDAFEATGGCTFHGSSKTSISPIAYRKSSKSSGISLAKVMRFSRVKRKMPPIRSIRRANLDDTKKVSTPEPPEMHLMGDMNKEDNHDGNPSQTAVTGGFGVGQDTGRTSAFEELQFGDNGDGKGAETSVSLSTDKSEKLDVQGQGHEDEGDDNLRAFELQSKLGTEDNPSNFSKYLSQGTPIDNRRVPARSTTEIYKDGLCDTENPTLPGIIIEDVGDGTNRQGPDVNLNIDTQVRQEYEVERILIPSPPGSFLPSPGALGSEEFQGNSSLTTSRVQSSQEQQDLATGGSSGSPISATSTVSNSAPAGSETKPLGPQVVEEKAWSGSSSGGAVEPLVSNAASTPQPSTAGVSSERKSIEKGPLILKNDDQPCCCQRKKESIQYIPYVPICEERSSQGVVPNYPESQLLRRRNLGSLTAIGLEKLPNQSPNMTPIPVEARHEMLPRGAVLEIESETTRPSLVPITFIGSTALGTKVSDRGEFDAATPATPSVCNPVLRLMGKNLMVVNNEEDASTPLGFSQPAAGAWSNNPSSSQVSRMSGVSSSSVPISFTDYRPAVGKQFQTVMEPPAALPRQFKTIMEPLAAPSGMPINWKVSGYNNGTFYYPNQPPRSNVAVPCPRDPRPMKEIIIIDDSPEDEITYMPANNVGRVGVSRERQASVAPPAVSFPMRPAQSYDPRLAGTFPFAYPSSQDPSFFGQVPISRRADSSTMGVRWCSSPPEGPGAFQQGHLVPAQSPNIHTRSQLPYSPGLQ